MKKLIVLFIVMCSFIPLSWAMDCLLYTSEEKYPVGSKHTAKVRNFTNFGVFVEIEEGVDLSLIHIYLRW